MIQGTQSKPGIEFPGTHARVRVRAQRYRAAFAAIGCKSNLAIARVCGLDPKSIYRLLDGEQVGEHVMARTIATLQQHEHGVILAEIGIEPTLDSLFEVTVEVCPDVDHR